MASLLGRPTQTGRAGSIVSRVTVLGIPELLAKLAQIGTIVHAQLGAAISGASLHMVALAQEYCPVVTGNLKSSIKRAPLGAYTWSVTAASKEGTDPGGTGKNSKEYAGFVENGWSSRPPEHFMRRAYDETKPLIMIELQVIARQLQAL